MQFHLSTLIWKWRKITKACQKNNVHPYIQLDGQSTYIYQELQRTIGGIQDSIQHQQNEELVQHYFHSPQASSSHVRYKKVMTCWTTSTRSRHLWISPLAWRYLWKVKILLWPCSRVCYHCRNNRLPFWRLCW